MSVHYSSAFSVNLDLLPGSLESWVGNRTTVNQWEFYLFVQHCYKATCGLMPIPSRTCKKEDLVFWATFPATLGGVALWSEGLNQIIERVMGMIEYLLFKLLVEGRIYLLCGLFLSFPRDFVVFSSFSEPYHAAVWAVRNLESRVSNAGSTQYGSICHSEHPTHLPRFGMVGMGIGHMETLPILFLSLSQFIAQLLSTYFESIQERFSLH